MNKMIIWTFYVVLILVLAIAGVFVGKTHNKPGLYAFVGGFVGLVISVILWFTVGKKMSKQ